MTAFDDLVEAALNGELTEEQHRRLEAILDEDPDARALYVRAMALDTDLWLGVERAPAPPVRRRWPAIPLGFAAAALLFAILLIVRETPTTAPLVAFRARGLSGAAGIAAGDVVRVPTGYGEILFAGGARLVLQGPAEAVVLWTQRASLRGRATLYVPKGDTAFSLETHEGTILPSEGEFGVETGSGETRVLVFRGMAELQPRGRGPSVLLTMGGSKRLTEAGIEDCPAEGSFLQMSELAEWTRTLVLDEPFEGGGLSSRWQTVLPDKASKVVSVDGRLRLENRAWLATVESYDPVRLGGLRIRGRWRFDGPSGGDPNARVNIFSAVLRADLGVGPAYFEAAAGIKLNCFTDAGRVFVVAEGGRFELSPSRREGGLRHAKIGTYAFEILDDGHAVSFSVWDASAPSNVARARATVLRDAQTSDRILIYGREFHAPDRAYAVELDHLTLETGVGP